MKWIAFFSQTGSEIVNISEHLNQTPDLIVTNNLEENNNFHPGIRRLGSTIMSSRHDTLMNYFKTTTLYEPEETLITLHGYLRIIPPEITSKYKIYNGHPGAINLFPELKGKDPQEKVWNEKEKYNIIGSVVHRVTAEVDSGDILTSVVMVNDAKTKEEVYSILKMTSLQSWLKFFDEYV